MRYACLVVVCLAAGVSSYAGEIDDVEGLRGAIDAHEAALLSGDSTEISNTVLYPHVQFYPDGRLMQIREPADLPSRSNAQRQWRVSDAELVTYEAGIAIVRTSFERTGDAAGPAIGAGLWCFLLTEGKWRIYWRHYLGRNESE